MRIEVLFVSCSFIIFWTTSHEKKNKNTFFGAYTSIPRKSIIQMLIFIEFWAVYSFSKCTRPVDTILSAGSLFGFFFGELCPVWTKRNLLVVCFEPAKNNFHWNETKKKLTRLVKIQFVSLNIILGYLYLNMALKVHLANLQASSLIHQKKTLR